MHIALIGVNILMSIFSMLFSIFVAFRSFWRKYNKNEDQKLLEYQFESLAEFVRENENLFPLEFEREKNIIGAQAAAKYYRHWMPQMRWLDANKIKRIEFSQNEVLLYIIKKYKLNMKYRVVRMVE